MARVVLTRREGERIMVGDDIEITIREARGGAASVIVDAPADVPVHRLEVWKRIRDERRRAVPAKAAGAEG